MIDALIRATNIFRAKKFVPVSFLSGMLSALSAVLLVPIIVLLSILSIPFGFDTVVSAALFDLSVEASPPGTFKINTIVSHGEGMAHSAAYESDEVIVRMGEWIERRAKMFSQI